MRGQALVKAFVPLPGSAQAIYTTAGLQHYRRPDWLGSSRLSTTTTAGAKYYDVEYAPYGENYGGTTGTGGAVDLTFTGQNQDTVTTFGGLYDFLYREYNPVQGRWISPDPAGLGAVNPADPQSWNRYAYVNNGPLNHTDPQGLDDGGDWGGWGGGWGDGGWSEQLPIYTGPALDPSLIIWNLRRNDQGMTVGDIGETNCTFGTADSSQCLTWDPVQQLWDSAPAPNKGTPWYKNSCVTGALKTGAINAGIDAIGFIPEAGGLARMIGHGSGYRGVVADQLGHRVIKAVGKTAGVENSAIGFDSSDWTSYVSAGITIGDFIPVVNEFTTVAALAWDTGVAAYKVYQCPK